MAPKNREGVCHICGKADSLSFEHIPPRSVGNINTSKAYKVVDIVERTGKLDLTDRQGVKFRQEQRGAGFSTLCRKCNSYLGKYYVPEYKKLHLATANLFETEPCLKQASGLHVKTDKVNVLAIFKHVVSNFCVTTQAGTMWDCSDFLLDYSSNVFPKHLKVFMYAIPDASAGMVTTGWVKMFTSIDLKDYYTVAYVAMFPLGFALFDTRESSVNPGSLGCEITPIATRKWGEEVCITLNLPYMQLDSGFPILRNSDYANNQSRELE